MLQPRAHRSSGASPTYSDLAIATFETVKLVYGLAGRQTEGFLGSLLALLGVDLPMPEHSPVSRRKAELTVELPVMPSLGMKNPSARGE